VRWNRSPKALRADAPCRAYDKECETIAVMKSLCGEGGFAFSGKHHEIYLSDPRRVLRSGLRPYCATRSGAVERLLLDLLKSKPAAARTRARPRQRSRAEKISRGLV